MSVAATGAAGLVADVWRPSPVRDARADAILCVFAPRNPSEFARILREEGRLVVVTPRENHLGELRRAGLLIGMQEDKLNRLDAALGEEFELVERSRLTYPIELTSAEAEDLTTMGPSGHHATGRGIAGEVTVSVDCSVFALRGATKSA
jgi:23S rRNA (guanine745-N1)-methyltransferase